MNVVRVVVDMFVMVVVAIVIVVMVVVTSSGVVIEVAVDGGIERGELVCAQHVRQHDVPERVE